LLGSRTPPPQNKAKKTKIPPKIVPWGHTERTQTKVPRELRHGQAFTTTWYKQKRPGRQVIARHSQQTKKRYSAPGDKPQPGIRNTYKNITTETQRQAVTDQGSSYPDPSSESHTQHYGGTKGAMLGTLR